MEQIVIEHTCRTPDLTFLQFFYLKLVSLGPFSCIIVDLSCTFDQRIQEYGKSLSKNRRKVSNQFEILFCAEINNDVVAHDQILLQFHVTKYIKIPILQYL